MSSVEKVKMLCKENKIAIYKLEKDLGFGNGYISQLKKGSFPSDRLQSIATYFGVSVNYLIDEEESEDVVGKLSKAKQDFINEIMDWPDEQIKALTEAARAFKAMYQK